LQKAETEGRDYQQKITQKHQEVLFFFAIQSRQFMEFSLILKILF